ncbi:MAG: phosphatase PAP2 family protein [Bryobacterales bacterium]|nr:phosphatase PAP2 family protein [Bryobacterales bacterium]
MNFRTSEIILLAYFFYASILAVILPVPPAMKTRVLAANGALLLTYILIQHRALTKWRDWLPYPLILLAYKEIGWLALPHTSTALEESWVRWDRLLLNDWGLRPAIESLGSLVPNLLELSYLLVYAAPAYAIALLLIKGYSDRIDTFYVVLLLGTLGAYALYPYFPSEPPRSVFPDQDMPTVMSVFRRLNLHLVNGYGIHTSVFPSGHVAASFSAAFGLWLAVPEQRKHAIGLAVLAALIAVATVYGRYHYAVDALAGFAVAAAALIAGAWMTRGARKRGPRLAL